MRGREAQSVAPVLHLSTPTALVLRTVTPHAAIALVLKPLIASQFAATECHGYSMHQGLHFSEAHEHP